jgi:carboxymethylenebutenolidase
MGRDIVLDTPRGAIGAWRADPVAAPRGGLVVVQEIYGVNAHIRSVAERYAAEGYVAIAPAFFDAAPGGAHGIELGYTRGETARGRALVDALGLDAALSVVDAAAGLLRGIGLKAGVVGFCWGGTVALLANTRLGLPAVSYYGARNLPYLDEPLRAPMQFHFGERDPSIPSEAIAAHRAQRPDAQVFSYPGAGHAFNRDSDPGHYAADAARQAHARAMALFADALA